MSDKLVPTDNVLTAQVAHEAAVRVRLRLRQRVRDLEPQGGAQLADAYRAYEGAVVAEARVLRELHVTIAADMGVPA